MEHVAVANFRLDWIRENIRGSRYLRSDQVHPEVEATALLLAEANSKGISRAALERDVGNLEDFLAECIEAARDRDADRRAGLRR